MKRGTKIGWILVTLSVALGIIFFVSGGSDAELSEEFVTDGQMLVQYNGSGGSVTIPDGIYSIAGGVFNSNTNLNSINLNQVETIGSDAFAGCTNLSSVSFGNTKTIGSGAFSGCSSLSSLSLSGVKTIGDGAFYNCNGLSSVTIPSSVDNISTTAFDLCGNLTSFSASSGSYRSSDGALYNGAGTRLLIVPEGKTSISIPGSCTTIGGDAFSYCDNIDSLTIPSSVTNIESQSAWSPSTIYGYSDSAAETYTYGKDIVFIPLDSPVEPVDPSDPEPVDPGTDPVDDPVDPAPVTTYTVTYDANGHGTSPGRITVQAGSYLAAPSPLTAPGFVFGGWYKEAECKNPWSFNSDRVNSDITLYARWTPAAAGAYVVSFDVQGIGETPASQAVLAGAYASAPTAPSAEGYNFGGWFKDKECTESFDFSNTPVNSDITLYAKWVSVETGDQVAREPSTGNLIDGRTRRPYTGSAGYSGAHAGSQNGSTGDTHELDQTPTTADGDIDPRFLLIFLLLLSGVGILIYSRIRSLSLMADSRNGKGM